MTIRFSAPSVVAAAVSAVLLACGGTQTPPPPPSSSSGDTSSSSAPSSSAAPAPESSGGATAALASPPAGDTDAGGAPAPKPVSFETKDECTPVGVDFEKRARPKLKDCYAAGKKKNASLEGTVKIKVTVDLKGKIKSVKVIEKTLPDPVAECMLKAVKATPFPEVDKCWDSTLTIPITFPTPR